MNGYDFDKTIFKGNSEQRFASFCFIRLPYLILLLPEILLALILYGLKFISKDRFLHMLELFVIFVPNRDYFVKRFWDKNQKRVKDWYVQSKHPTDIVVSASADYLIGEICSRMGIRCIASHTRKNGTVIGKHCYGSVKVDLYKKYYGDEPLKSFYSDSMSDRPMFVLAEDGYFVKGDEITHIYHNGLPCEN